MVVPIAETVTARIIIRRRADGSKSMAGPVVASIIDTALHPCAFARGGSSRTRAPERSLSAERHSRLFAVSCTAFDAADLHGSLRQASALEAAGEIKESFRHADGGATIERPGSRPGRLVCGL